ncbi:MAG: tripartite tricarboxylate transporter TctB family protein [Acidiferrobacterales bacterium]|nr:tripartite tricarboxylate transporter TctB family protein [Acidiferrobacterales bacterium]
MGLDRYIALIFLVVCVIYGYTAFFTMDQGLAPIMQRNPIWPSTFPKVLSVLGIAVSLWIVLGFEKSRGTAKIEIDYRRLTEYKLGQAVLLLSLMAVYALILRPAGFLVSTTLFIVAATAILGERKWLVMCFIAVLASVVVWYLVDGVLGVYMRPFPSMFL